MPKYTQRPNIPGLNGLPDAVRTVMLPVKQLLEIHEGRAGNPAVDRFVKAGEVTGLINQKVSATTRPSDGEAPDPPTNVAVLAGAWGNRISWTNATNDDLWAVEVWAAKDVNDWTEAVLVAVVTIPQDIRGKRSEYVHFPASLTSDYYYWVRSVDYSGNFSRLAPSGENDGILAPGEDTIGETIDQIMEALTPANAPPWSAVKDDYEAGDIVAHDGRQWQCYNAPVAVGVEPDSVAGADYWRRTGILIQGDVDGIPTVGVDGRLVVDQSILARSIATDQLQVGENITVGNGVIVIENLTEETVAALDGMTDEEADLVEALQDQADNKVSVYVQPSTNPPSWTDSNDNHINDEWYQTDTKKWFRFTGGILGWVENDDSIYNIEALANGKTTVHYITDLADLTDPENDLSSAPDGDYCIYESGDDRKYFKRASGSWVLSSEMTNGADATQAALNNGASLDFTYVKGDTLLAGDHIRTDLLLVDTAQIVTGAIKYAKIGDAEIGTLKVAGNAITTPISAFTSGEIVFDNTQWLTIESLLFTTYNSPDDTTCPVHLTCCGEVIEYRGGAKSFAVRILRSTTELYATDAVRGILVDADKGFPFSISIEDNPPENTSVTYYLQIKMITASGDMKVHNCSIVGQELKR